MGLYTRQDSFTSQPPLNLNDERDETFIIDVLGTWIPECELIYYGLLGSEEGEALYKMRELPLADQKKTYQDMCFFTGPDLVRYLSAVDDSLDDTITDDEVSDLISTAFSRYIYVPCSETMLRHSIIEIMYHRFVKSVTLVYPWDIRPIDVAYLHHIIPESIYSKIELATGTIPEVIRMTGLQYTTAIMNSIDEITELVDNTEEYHTSATLFLLRNHSENMSVVRNPETGIVEFVEDHMDVLLPKLIDMKTGVPKSQIRFGRFEPQLFSVMEQRVQGFKNY